MTDAPDLLILRHGETEWNLAGRFHGELDSPLSARGRAQAVSVGGLLRDLGVTAATHDLWSSPQGRAVETARLALGPLAMTPRLDARLAEIRVGDWTGLHRDEIRRRWPGPEGEDLLAFYGRAPAGEPVADLWERAVAVLREIRRIGRPAVVVTHGITSRALRAAALGWDAARMGELQGGQGVIHLIRGGRHEEHATAERT
jgi:glucosyl-3-phosphoglycerate phosphatase